MLKKPNFHHPSSRVNAIKLSQGEHAGSPLQSLNTWIFVGQTCMSALNLMTLSSRVGKIFFLPTI
ncbi:MAG: hypothetical protein KAI83_17600 [Thiomargarita sp.]|nr:hypothetical protein [Thiomargarita sp.]